MPSRPLAEAALDGRSGDPVAALRGSRLENRFGSRAMPVLDLGISGGPSGSAEPRVKMRVEGGCAARRHADRSLGSRVAEGSKARAGRSDRRRNDQASRRQCAEGARRVFWGRACTVTDDSQQRHERRSPRKSGSRREEHLEEHGSRRGERLSGRLTPEPTARGSVRSNASKSASLVRGSPLAGQRILLERHGGTAF
jgi:hypothetical protein